METFSTVDEKTVPVDTPFQIIDPKTEVDLKTTMVDLVLKFNELYYLGKRKKWEKMYGIKDLFTAIVEALFSVYGPPLGYDQTTRGLREFKGDLSQTKHSLIQKADDFKIKKSPPPKKEKRFFSPKYSQRYINFSY